MRLIVTGATGFVGEALVTAAATAGHTGLATGRRAPERLPVGWEGWCRDGILASDARCHADAVIHLEAHRPGNGTGAADELVRTNVGGTRAWLEWAARQGIGTFVQASSVLAVSRTPGPIDETAAPQSVEPYGASKARAEVEVRRWAEEAPSRRAVILRPAPVYGPHPRSNLVSFVRRVAAGKTSMIGRGAARKSILARDNFVAAALHVAARASPGCAIYNVADREALSIAELAAIVAGLTGAPPPRSAPAWAATLAAPLADLVAALSSRDLPLSSARLRAATNPGFFPCDRLVATGFEHPLSTQDGLALLVDTLELGIECRPGRRARLDRPGD